jgi:hypothetical protein
VNIQVDKALNALIVPLGQAKTRTKAQKHALNRLIQTGKLTDVITYLESFSGKWGYVPIDKLKQEGTDKLADKREGSIKAMFDRMLDTDESHKPYSDDQGYIGVEIECFIPFRHKRRTNFEVEESETCDHCGGSGMERWEDEDGDECCSECEYCGGDGSIGSDDDAETQCHNQLAELFRTKRVKYSSIKGDGSIDNPEGTFPVEITVLTRLDRPDNLRHLCQVLSDLGAKVNPSCGMHVHLDARHLTKRAVIKIGDKFANALPALLSMVPESRRVNRFCRPSVSQLSGDRYHAINLTAFKKYKTIEVRLHSSTTNFDKIFRWASLISKIMHAPRLNETCLELNDLTNFIHLDEPTLEYFSQRIALFSSNEQLTDATAADADAVA